MFDVPKFSKGPVIIAVGPVMDMVNKATEGLKVSVVHVTQVEPLAAIDRILSLQNPKRQFIIVEHSYSSRIGDKLAETAFPTPIAVSHFSVPVKFAERYGHRTDIDISIDFTANKLRERIIKCGIED
jgi:transketolase C-terminal domain/subunit